MNRHPRTSRWCGLLCAGLLFGGAAVSVAAMPIKGGTYKGKVTPTPEESDKPNVRLRISGSGSSLNFRGPHESCGGTFNSFSAFFPVIKNITISSTGTFAKTRTYIDRSNGAADLDWTVKVSNGRFTSPNRATGNITWHLRALPAPGKRLRRAGKDCGKQSGTWVATR